MNSSVVTLLFLAIIDSVIGQGIHINPYVPVLVVPKNPLVQCPSSCSSAKDCFLVHPLSENHFYSCFHGKAMVHQCPIGKSFSDEKHQCIVSSKHSAINGFITNSKVAKLTQKIVLLEHLIESFQEKMTKVQKVIIDSDNKIGLLGKFLLKALKTNQENYCSKTNPKESEGNATLTPVVANPESVPAVLPVAFTPLPGSADEEEQLEQNGLASIGDEDADQEVPPSVSVPANSPKVNLQTTDEQGMVEEPQLSKDDDDFVSVDVENVGQDEDTVSSLNPQESQGQTLGDDDEGVQVEPTEASVSISTERTV